MNRDSLVTTQTTFTTASGTFTIPIRAESGAVIAKQVVIQGTPIKGSPANGSISLPTSDGTITGSLIKIVGPDSRIRVKGQ